MKEINNLETNTKTTKYKFKKQICILVFLSLFLLISFFRVPIVGILLDSIIFDFLFGYAKYFIYLLLLLFLIFYLNKKRIYFLFSKRKIIFYSSFIIFSCLLLSTINLYINKLDNLSFSEFYLNNKYSYLNNWYNSNLKNILNIKNYLNFNIYSYGGLIGTFFISIMNKYSFIIFLLIALILIVIIYLLVFNKKISKKLKNKAINKLGGFSSQQIKINTKQTIRDINNLCSETKELILKELDFIPENININDNEIEININETNQVEIIVNTIKKLKIENVKIIININNLKENEKR